MSVRESVIAYLLMCSLGVIGAAETGSLVTWPGPVPVPEGNDIVAVSAGYTWALALRSDGTLAAAGENNYGRCDVPSGNDFVAISAGYSHGLALRSDGSLVGWGNDTYGRATVPEGSDFAAVAAGDTFSLALKKDGSLEAWGWNYWGECNVPSGNDFVAIAAASSWGAALRSDGTLAAWGWNNLGQTNVPDGQDFVDIACGGLHGLAIRTDGSLAAWGCSYYGVCTVPEGNDFVAVSAGWTWSVALRADGTLVAWGRNDDGRCNVPAGSDFIGIAAGDNFYGVGLMADKPCPFQVSDFDEPMGMKKKLGSTLPVKFQLFFGDVSIQTQAELDAALDACDKPSARPEIVLSNVTDSANAIGIELPEDGTNVGEGGDLGFCFRFSDEGECVYNLRLDSPEFLSGNSYMVQVKIADCVLKPGNELFQAK